MATAPESSDTPAESTAEADNPTFAIGDVVHDREDDDPNDAMYLDGTATDDRLEGALDGFRPLPKIGTDAAEEKLRAVIRDVVCDELDYADHTRVR